MQESALFMWYDLTFSLNYCAKSSELHVQFLFFYIIFSPYILPEIHHSVQISEKK